MGIALLTFVDLLSPLQSLANRWMPERRARRSFGSAGLDLHADLRYVAVRPACAQRASGTAATPGHGASPVAPKPLRVVRTIDAQHSGGRAARVVLSGRLTDVCAELDRLAALEAADMLRGSRPLH